MLNKHHFLTPPSPFGAVPGFDGALLVFPLFACSSARNDGIMFGRGINDRTFSWYSLFYFYSAFYADYILTFI